MFGQQAPRKTIVGPTGRAPIKAVVGRTNAGPLKTVVGNTGRSPIKTVVGRGPTSPRKTLVGNLGAPPRKITAGNLGTGRNSGLGFGLDRGPTGAARPSLGTRSLGRGDGNLGKSVGSMPAPAKGPANPVMDHDGFPGVTTLQSGGMGQTRMKMGRVPRRKRAPRSAFFGE